MLIPGMGHDLPRVLWPRLIEAIADHVAGADAARSGAAAQTPADPSVPTRSPVPGLQG
jgi:hypothetical protein